MIKKSKENQKKNYPKSVVLNVYKIHKEALKRFVSRLLSNTHDVDDVIQEAFLRAYNAENTKTIDQPKSYLFRVAKNVALNHLREKTRRPTDYLEDYNPTDVLESQWTLEDEVIAQQRLEIHCAAVAVLPPMCRKVYLMRKVYAMSYKEISSALGISISTVESHIGKGFARCDAYVEEKLSVIGESNRPLIRKQK